MIHWRRKLIDAAKAAVLGTPTVGGAVFEFSGRAVPEKHKRWIAVIPRSESPADSTGQEEQGVTLSLDFVAAARTAEHRDVVSLELQEALYRSPLADKLDWTGTTLSDPDVEGDASIYEAIHSYTLTYQHPFESPGTE